MNNAQVTFIHELGHHVANELSYHLFDYNGKTLSISLYPSKHGNFFDGKTVCSNPIKDAHSKENYPIEYVRMYYGCLFECLYREIKIEKCLCSMATQSDLKANLCTGRHDYYQMYDISIKPEVKNRFSWWRYLTVEYFNLMKTKKDEFGDIFQLRVQDLAAKTDIESWEIDVCELNIRIESFLSKHKNDYTLAVKKLTQLNKH
ncbi:hypothetical protein FGF1_40600 [Flavobacteriaceae bacterium GF1]